MTVGATGGASTSTDTGGLYGLLLPSPGRIVVGFEKTGFVTTYGIADGTVPMLTLNKVMVPARTPQTIDCSDPDRPCPANDTTLVAADWSKVVFPSGSIDATAPVNVVITPVDPSGPQIGTFPGDFQAVDPSNRTRRVLLESFALLNVVLTDRVSGAPVNLSPESNAVLQFLLPVNTTLTAGEQIELSSFNTTTGL